MQLLLYLFRFLLLLTGLIGALLLLSVAVEIWREPPSPLPGTGVKAPVSPVSAANVRFLFDQTAWQPEQKRRVIQQEIFDHALEMIAQAEHFVVADFFLWNTWQGATPETHRALADELTDALLKRKQQRPGLPILVLTDPLNRFYGNHLPPHFSRLRDAGIPVVFTDLDRMPDSNPIVSTPVRAFLALADRIPSLQRTLDTPRWNNPLQTGGAPLSTREILTLLHFKANHRKVLLTDGGDPVGVQLLVTSLNPADASAAHSNQGLLLQGTPARHALETELRLARASAQAHGHLQEDRPGRFHETTYAIIQCMESIPAIPPSAPRIEAQWLTEGHIRARILEAFRDADKHTTIRLALFYLSDRGVLEALLQAARRGADIRLLLDPNRDAFGREKQGIPNRPVAAELMRTARQENLRLVVRWADTHGEQFHLKTASWTTAQRSLWIGGSANWTRRNLQDLNLECAVALEGDPDVFAPFHTHFDELWTSPPPLQTSLPYNAYAPTGPLALWQSLRYRLQETTGLCTH